jgi:hypothetical protein
MWAGGRGASVGGCAGRSRHATGVAAEVRAAPHPRPERITSGTGPTAVTPVCATSSACASCIIGSFTRAASRSPSPNPAGGCSSHPTAGAFPPRLPRRPSPPPCPTTTNRSRRRHRPLVRAASRPRPRLGVAARTAPTVTATRRRGEQVFRGTPRANRVPVRPGHDQRMGRRRRANGPRSATTRRHRHRRLAWSVDQKTVGHQGATSERNAVVSSRNVAASRA